MYEIFSDGSHCAQGNSGKGAVLVRVKRFSNLRSQHGETDTYAKRVLREDNRVVEAFGHLVRAVKTRHVREGTIVERSERTSTEVLQYLPGEYYPFFNGNRQPIEKFTSSVSDQQNRVTCILLEMALYDDQA